MMKVGSYYLVGYRGKSISSPTAVIPSFACQTEINDKYPPEFVIESHLKNKMPQSQRQ